MNLGRIREWLENERICKIQAPITCGFFKKISKTNNSVKMWWTIKNIIQNMYFPTEF